MIVLHFLFNGVFIDILYFFNLFDFLNSLPLLFFSAMLVDVFSKLSELTANKRGVGWESSIKFDVPEEWTTLRRVLTRFPNV